MAEEGQQFLDSLADELYAKAQEIADQTGEPNAQVVDRLLTELEAELIGGGNGDLNPNPG